MVLTGPVMAALGEVPLAVEKSWRLCIAAELRPMTVRLIQVSQRVAGSPSFQSSGWP
jgi:hypothetical protein